MKNIDRISIAKISDTNEIMNFINNEWKQNHILSSNKKFFLYEYKNRKALNFVIHKNQSNKIDGILGFLKSSSDKNASIWTTMWKVSKFNGSPMLGIELLNCCYSYDSNSFSPYSTMTKVSVLFFDEA